MIDLNLCYIFIFLVGLKFDSYRIFSQLTKRFWQNFHMKLSIAKKYPTSLSGRDENHAQNNLI